MEQISVRNMDILGTMTHDQPDVDIEEEEQRPPAESEALKREISLADVYKNDKTTGFARCG